MKKYTTCPACRGFVDSTVKKAALAQTETGYRDEITVNCPTCGAEIVARLEWTPVIVSVELVSEPPAWDDPESIADFFTGPAGVSDKDPYEAFGEWAAANGYDVDDEAQLQAAIEAYGGEK